MKELDENCDMYGGYGRADFRILRLKRVNIRRSKARMEKYKMGGGSGSLFPDLKHLADPKCKKCHGAGMYYPPDANGVVDELTVKTQCPCVSKKLDELCAGIGSVATGLDNPLRKRKKHYRSIDEIWEGG